MEQIYIFSSNKKTFFNLIIVNFIQGIKHFFFYISFVSKKNKQINYLMKKTHALYSN